MCPDRSNPTTRRSAAPLGWSNSGWRLVALWALGLALLCTWVLASRGSSDSALGLVARNAARSGFLAFVLTVGAGPLHQLWPGPGTAWLLRRRSQLGVAFALAHFLFLATNVARVLLHYGGHFTLLRPATTWVGGGALFLVIGALALTSFPGPARRLGPRAWRRLHLAGVWLLLAQFLLSYGLRALHDPFYIPFALAGIALVGLRAAAAFRSDRFGVRTRLAACASRCQSRG
jgi:DMSO/TMAO reductase YedYZ heme-binding membrane subunit